MTDSIDLNTYLKKLVTRETVLFVISGIINTLIGFITYSIFILYFQLDYKLAAFLSLALSVLAGFLQSRHGVFRRGNSTSLIRYLSLWTVLYFLSILLLGVLISQGFSEIQAYLIGIPVSVPISFLAQKYWVFK